MSKQASLTLMALPVLIALMFFLNLMNPLSLHEIETTDAYSLATHAEPFSISLNGRVALEAYHQSYEVLQLSLVEGRSIQSFHSTVEAIETYLKRLKPNGWLSITSSSKSELLRLLSAFYEATHSTPDMTDPAKQFMIFENTSPSAGSPMFNLQLSRAIITNERLIELKKFSQVTGMKIVFDPYDVNNTDPRFKFVHEWNRETLPTRNQEQSHQRTTDDRPVFYSETSIGKDRQLWLLLVMGAALALFLFYSRKKLSAPQWQNYVSFAVLFALVAGGTIFLQMALSQKFLLYLESPLIALLALIFGLYIGAVAGTFYLPHFAIKSLIATSLLIALILGLFFNLLPTLLSGTGDWPLLGRAMAVMGFMLPLGFLLGQYVPRVLKSFKNIGEIPKYCPWIFVILFSIVASGLAVTVSLHLGISYCAALGVALCFAAAYVPTGFAKFN